MTLEGIVPGLANVDNTCRSSDAKGLSAEFHSQVLREGGPEANSRDERIIGSGMLSFDSGMHYDMQAQYAPDSTEENPIVRVTLYTRGESVTYDISISEVNPRNATQLEMFALLSYADDRGLTDSGSQGSYQSMMVYAENACMNGHWEGNASYDDFVSETHDWQNIIIAMWDDYSHAGIYSQQLNCMKLNSTMEQFSIRFVDFDAITFVDRSMEVTYHSRMENLSAEVNQAWFEAAEATGLTGEDEENGDLMLQLYQGLMRRLREWQSSHGVDGESGSSVDAALQVAKEALRELEYPLTSAVRQRPEVQEEIEKEKKFYQAFIHKLEAMANPSAGKNIYKEETTVDAQRIIQDYIQTLLANAGSGETRLTYQIGEQSYTEEEWEKLLEQFDSAEEELRKLMAEEQLRMIAADRNGIRCGRPGQEEYEWELEFTEETQYYRALELMGTSLRFSDLLTL